MSHPTYLQAATHYSCAAFQPCAAALHSSCAAFQSCASCMILQLWSIAVLCKLHSITALLHFTAVLPGRYGVSTGGPSTLLPCTTHQQCNTAKLHAVNLQAASYYAQAKNSDALADALYRLEDFDGLEQLTAALPEGTPLLLHLGERFQSVGLCQQAATAYIKVGIASLCSCTWLCHL